MNDIKVSLNIILPGRVMYTKEECVKEIKSSYIDKKGHKRSKDTIVDDYEKYNLESMKVYSEYSTDILHIHTRKCKPATQSININKEAYEFMTSLDSAIGNPKQWKQMSKIKRLEAHLNNYAESLGGVLDNYVIFED